MSALSLKFRMIVCTIAYLGALAVVVPILFHLPKSAADIYRWQADDLNRIETLARRYNTQQNRRSFKRFMFKLNDERNRRMLERVIPYLEQGNAFIAIGALHLAGPQGLVSQLRDRGYRLEPVRQITRHR